MPISKAKIQLFFIFSLLLVFIFLNVFLASRGILTSLALCILFLLILLFVFNPQIGILVLIILRVALDYFRDWEIFVIQDLFFLNFGAALGVFIIIFTFFWLIFQGKKLLKIPNLLAIVLFLIILLISIFYSQDRFIALREWVRIASFFAIYFLMYILIRQLADDKISGESKYPIDDKTNQSKSRVLTFSPKLIQKTLLASAIIPSILGFWQIFTKSGLKDQSGFTRIYGSFAHPNAFSYFLVTILTLLIYFFITTENKKVKRYYLASIILGITLLLFTYSRGAWLAFLIILLFFGLLKYRKILFISLISLCFITLLSLGLNYWWQKNYNFSPLFNFPPIRRIIQAFSLDPFISSTLWRIELWRDMGEVFWEKPILGHGLGSFEEEALKQRGVYAGSYEAHNDYLHIAVELGLIGLISYILLILVVLKNIIKVYQKTEDKNSKIFVLSFLCLFISLFLVSSIENILRNTIVQWCFWTLAGCIFSLPLESGSNQTPHLSLKGVEEGRTNKAISFITNNKNNGL